MSGLGRLRTFGHDDKKIQEARLAIKGDDGAYAKNNPGKKGYAGVVICRFVRPSVR